MAPLSVSEAEVAVADFDGEAPASLADVQPIAAEPQAERQPEEAAIVPAPQPLAAEVETEKPPRRSTVREKVSFVSEAKPETPASVVQITQTEPAPPPAPIPPAPEPAATEATAPRRAGWWSRRFGGSGE
jgi:ribonuclease E